MSEMNEIGEIKAIAARSGYKGELSKGALEDCVAVYKRHLTRDGVPSPRSYWRAANHKRSNLSEFQWLLTNTDNFKKWFGKSVVVDENGEPKVMFHGSWNAFREFRVEQIKLSKTAMTLWSGPGFYFSDNRKSAEIYAGGKNNSIYEVFLRIEKPLIVDETGSSESPITKAQAEKIFLDGDNTQWLDSGIASELAQMDAEAGTKGKGGKHYYKGLTRAKRVSEYVSRLKTDVVKLKTAAKAFGAKSQKKLLDSVCRHTGHDGVIHTIEPGVKEYVVYDPKAIKSANSNDGEFSLSKATVEDSAMKEVNDKTDAQGRNHAPAGSSNGGQFVSSGELRGVAHRVRNHVLKGNPDLKGVPVDAYESEISRAVSGENKNVDSLISTLTKLRGALGEEHGLTKKVKENLNAVKGEDSAETKALTKKENVMKYENLIKALSSIGGSKEVAMDIIDRQGRHHKPKGIPPGGQYEEEGQYLTGQAKVDHAIREAGSGKRANLLREHVAPLYAFLGKDSMERAKIQAMHEDIRGLSKNALLRGMARHLKDMKRHADAYTAVKDMNKQEFLAWLDAHPEYKNELNMKLLNEGRYNKHFSVKGGYHDDGTGRQKHEAWEEAKWGIGARAMASLILFQEHSDALSGAPDAIMANMIAHASEEASLENREETPNQQIIANGEGERSHVGPSDEDFKDAATKFLSHKMGKENPTDQEVESAVNELKGFLEKAQNGRFDNTPAGGGIHSNDNQFLNDIVDVAGEDHPIVRAIREAAGITAPAPQGGNEGGEGAQHRPVAPADGSNTQGSSAQQTAELNHIAEIMSDDLGGTANIDTIKAAYENGDRTEFNGMVGRLSDNAVAEINRAVGQNSPIAEAIANIRSESRQQSSNAGGNAPAAHGMTYTDRDGNSHPVEHNPNGLKATIHPSELVAVQAEMRQAFADAGNEVDGAQEYAHALSHFLGRGNDERSQFPGMRQDGVLKHQLADKMEMRLKTKLDALHAAEEAHGENSVESAEARRDLDATQKAVKKISEICGITGDMLPEGENYGLVRSQLQSEGAGSASEGSAQNDDLYANTGFDRDVLQNALREFHIDADADTVMRAIRDGNAENLPPNLHAMFLGTLGSGNPLTQRVGELRRQQRRAVRATNPDHQGLVDALHNIGNPETAQNTQTTQQRNEFTDEELNRLYINEEGNFMPEDIRAAIEGRTGPDGIAPAEMARRLRAYNRGEQSELRNRIADEIERRQRNGGSPAQGAQRQNEMPRGQNTESAPLATHLNETRDENGNSTYNFNRQGYTYGDTRTRHAAYTWPVRGNRPIAREQITPELIRAVSAHLPTGFGTWRHNNMADRMEMLLENPMVNSGYSADRLLRNLMTSRNIHARRYMQLLNTLHPNYASERRRQEEERQERRRQEENQRTVNGLSSMASNRPEQSIPMNVTDEQLNDAVNRVIGSVGEQHRNEVQSAFNNFRQHGSITTDQLSQLESVIGSDHPVYQEAQRIARERMSREERELDEAKRFAPQVSNELKERHRKLAQDANVQFSETPIQTETRQGRGYNCYLTALVYAMRKAGFNIPYKERPSGYGSSAQKYFIPTKLAMKNAGWDHVNGRNHEETVANLERLRQTKPNGYQIELWSSSHHGTHAMLYNGKWYYSDVYNGYFNRPMTSDQLAGHIKSIGPDGGAELSEDQKRLSRIAILKGIPPQKRAQMSAADKEKFVQEALKKTGYDVESSYGHSPDQGFTKELIDAVMA